jgi:hypothetical protein
MGSTDARVEAIVSEFELRGYELVIERSPRGEERGGWLARYRPMADAAAPGGISRGNTELEAAELAWHRFRTSRLR